MSVLKWKSKQGRQVRRADHRVDTEGMASTASCTVHRGYRQALASGRQGGTHQGGRQRREAGRQGSWEV